MMCKSKVSIGPHSEHPLCCGFHPRDISRRPRLVVSIFLLFFRVKIIKVLYMMCVLFVSLSCIMVSQISWQGLLTSSKVKCITNMPSYNLSQPMKIDYTLGFCFSRFFNTYPSTALRSPRNVFNYFLSDLPLGLRIIQDLWLTVRG